MKVREIRNSIIVCVGLGAALYMEMTGRRQEAETICSSTLLIWWLFL